jgi:hypothetical protein
LHEKNLSAEVKIRQHLQENIMTNKLLSRIFLNTTTTTIIIMIVAATFASIAYAQNSPRYLDKKGLFERKEDFSSLGVGIGYLENTKFLKEKEKQSVKQLQDRMTALKQKYKSQPMDEMWQQIYDITYKNGAEQAKTADVIVEAKLNARDTDFRDPYTCTTLQLNNKTGVKSNYHSHYVQSVNDYIVAARKDLYFLENYLPKPKNSGIMMLTEADHYKINGESVFCIPLDGSPNPAIAKETEAIEKVKNAKKRIPPYSESRKPQHEIICQSLYDPGIPPPFGAKCVFNYK